MENDDQPEPLLVDPEGQPIPSKPTSAQRARKVAKKSKAFLASCVAIIAVVAGLLANLDKISGFFSPGGKPQWDANWPHELPVPFASIRLDTETCLWEEVGSGSKERGSLSI